MQAQRCGHAVDIFEERWWADGTIRHGDDAEALASSVVLFSVDDFVERKLPQSLALHDHARVGPPGARLLCMLGSKPMGQVQLFAAKQNASAIADGALR